MSPDTVAGDVTDLAGQYCLVSRSWGKNYCHFTFQSLDQIVLMEQAGYEGKYLVLRTDFAEQLLDLMGVDRDRIAWIDDLREGQVCRFERLFVLDPEKYSFRATAHLNLAAARMIESCIGEPTHEYPSRLFVKRVGSRKLLGADALLERYGFVTIVPDDLSVKEQISYFHHADVVVCPHGANSANALYMRPGTVFVETFGKGWVFPWCTEVHLLKGVRDLPVVESPIFPDDHGGQYDDYRVPGELLEMAIRNAIELAQGSQALCLPPKRWSARDGYTHPSQAYWDLGSQTKGC